MVFEDHIRTFEAPEREMCQVPMVVSYRRISCPDPRGDIDGTFIKTDGGGGVHEVNCCNRFPPKG